LSPDNPSAIGGKPLGLMASVFGSIDPVPVTTLRYLLYRGKNYVSRVAVDIIHFIHLTATLAASTGLPPWATSALGGEVSSECLNTGLSASPNFESKL
jgi:hypothetical protein